MAAYNPKVETVEEVACFLSSSPKTGQKSSEEVTSLFWQVFPDIAEKEDPRIALGFDNISKQLEKRLSDLVADVKLQNKRSCEGILRPEEVLFDATSHVGNILVDADRLGLSSHSNFSTLCANTCVYKGKWIYEVMLGSKGVMQLGWCTHMDKFTLEEGVGDTPDSYSFDGNRLRKWNVKTHKYGQNWLTGDVITCAIDCDIGTVSFQRNGNDLGVAFDNLQLGPGIAYFPAISLSLGENIRVNFGATPMRYPLEEYAPLQPPPMVDLLKADLLLGYLDRLLTVLISEPKNVILTDKEKGPHHFDSDHSNRPVLMLMMSHVIEKISPYLLNRYIVESCLLKFLLKYCHIDRPYDEQVGVTNILNTLWSFLEDFEVERCLEYLAVSLLTMYRFSPVTIDFIHQKKYLTLTLAILRHEDTRKFLLKSVLFDKIKFPIFLHIKPPDDELLSIMVPTVWWQYNVKDEEHCYSTKKTILEETGAREKHLMSCDILQSKILELEDIQIEILKCLLLDDDKSLSSSSRFMFMNKFRCFLKENINTGKVAQIDQCPLPVILCFLHRLIRVWRYYWHLCHADNIDAVVHAEDVFVPHHAFYEDKVKYWDIQRFGGLLSHLTNTYKEDITKDQIRLAAGSTDRNVKEMFVESTNPEVTSLVEILDGILLLCNSARHQIKKMSSLRESGDEVLVALKETVDKIDRCPLEMHDVMAELQKAKKVLQDKLIDQGRQMAWVRSVIYSKDKCDDIAWILKVALKTISEATEHRVLFGFVPEFYIEVCLNTYQALTQYFHPTTDFQHIQGNEELLRQFAIFLSSHFADIRIVNTDLKDTIVQFLACFICFSRCLHILENIDDQIKENMIRSLLDPYENRSWAQSNWILIRLWKGNGFAFRYVHLPHLTPSKSQGQDVGLASLQKPCPSQIFQDLVAKILDVDNEHGVAFLDSVLNQLNWSFSEFIGMLQELQSIIPRPGSHGLIDTRQLKICATCFDIAVGLLRVLEMVVTVTPQVFLDWSRTSAEQLLARLFQSLCQILNRVTAKTNLFEMIISIGLPGLETVDHFPIVTAVMGILVQMVVRMNLIGQKRSLAALLAEPGFQLSTLEFVLGPKASVEKGFNLRTYKEVSQQELADIEKLVSLIHNEQCSTGDVPQSGDDEELCTICYANPLSCTFKPCRHKSCKACISHHLMNKKECFFCKSTIERVEDRHGNTIKGLHPPTAKRRDRR